MCVCLFRHGENVPVNCAPLAVEPVFNDGMNRHFWHAASQQAQNITTPLVNFTLRSLAVIVTLAGADESAFGDFYL